MTTPNTPHLPNGSEEQLMQLVFALANDLAIDLAEKLHVDFSYVNSPDREKQFRQQFVNEKVLKWIKLQFGNVDSDFANFILDNVWDKIKNILKLQEEKRLAAAELDSLSATARESDRFVRVMPASNINPEPGKDLLDGNIRRAALGFWHKLDRATRLGSKKEYDLKPRSQGNSANGWSYTRRVEEKQSDLVSNIPQKTALAQTIVELESLIKSAEATV